MRVLLAALVLLALAGCGGNGGSSNDRLTSDELAQKADAICAEYERRIDALALTDPKDLAELKANTRSAHDALADGLAELRKLRPPAELQARYNRWVAAGDRALARIGDLQTALARGDQVALLRLAAAARLAEVESDRLAAELGMVECAND